MRTYLDCIPCFLRQTLDAARMVSADQPLQQEIVREVLGLMQTLDLSRPAPVMAQQIHRCMRRLSGNSDPYAAVRRRQNRMAAQLVNKLRSDLDKAEDKMEYAVKLAIAGNIIDLGAKGNVTPASVDQSVVKAVKDPVAGDIKGFRRAVEEADKILYLMDNAGEIVFDKLLLEQLPLTKITAAVRGAPVINDAVMSDAEEVGICDMVNVIDNGSDAPGTVLEECSSAFTEYFNNADLIIAKGQGNYESLSDTDVNIIFLFQVKCNLVAEQTGLPTGTHVMLNTGV